MGSQRARYAIVSEDTWARIKAAYLAGASARELSAQYGVTTDAIYKKSFREHWTKKAHAASQPPLEPAGLQGAAEPPPPIDPARPVESALAGAGLLMSQGRVSEAGAYLKFAQTVGRITGGAGGPLTAAADIEHLEDEEWFAVCRIRLNRALEAGRPHPFFIDREKPKPSDKEAERFWAIYRRKEQEPEPPELLEEEWKFIERCAYAMLDCYAASPSLYSRAIARWRAERFGPEATERDREDARRGGWYERVFEEDGAIKPAFE